MTTDALVTNDLAALATDSRRGIAAIDALLVPPASSHEELRMLAPARIYARRVATLVSSAVAIVYSMGLLFIAWDPFHLDSEDGDEWMMIVRHAMVVKLALVVLGARSLATHLASRSFERRLRAGASARSLMEALDGWSVALGIAGTTALVVILGVRAFGYGEGTWGAQWSGHYIAPTVSALVWQPGVAIAIGIGLSVALGRAVSRERRWARMLEGRLVAVAGGIALLVTAYVAMRCDPGDLGDVYISSAEVDLRLRLALTLCGMLGAFALSASLSLRRRRREISELGRSIT